jgi:hypothetical protein
MPDPRIDGSTSIHATGVQTLPRRQRTFDRGRCCAEPGCQTKLSIYNSRDRCWLHEPAHVFHPKVGRTRNSDRRLAGRVPGDPGPTVPPPMPSPDPQPVPDPEPPPSPIPTAQRRSA